jgi:hypothetical protein
MPITGMPSSVGPRGLPCSTHGLQSRVAAHWPAGGLISAARAGRPKLKRACSGDEPAASNPPRATAICKPGEASMTVQLKEEAGGKILEVQMSGKLTKADYEEFVPSVERLIEQHKRIRILLSMHDFHGWDAGALWEDTKFSVKHFKDIERLAIVGETKWERGMATFCKPFTMAKIKYFDQKDAAQARAWIEEA